MSAESQAAGPDLIRWTFTPEAAKRDEIVALLLDHGFEVHTRDDGPVVATWDEPEGDPDEVVEELWAIHGEPFEVTHEEFRRTELLVYHHEDEGTDQAAA